MKQRTYEIGGRTFVQKPLVLGQLGQVIDLLSGMALPVGDTPALIAALAGAGLLPRALAIVLCEPGKSLKDKDLDGLAEFMAENADYLTTLEVVEDFFDLTRPDSIFAKVALIAETLRKKIAESSPLSAFSPAGTSPGGTKSSGDTASENASPT